MANKITLGEEAEILITSTVTAGHRLRRLFTGENILSNIWGCHSRFFADSQQSHGQLSRIVWEKQSRMQLLPCFFLSSEHFNISKRVGQWSKRLRTSKKKSTSASRVGTKGEASGHVAGWALRFSRVSVASTQRALSVPGWMFFNPNPHICDNYLLNEQGTLQLFGVQAEYKHALNV